MNLIGKKLHRDRDQILNFCGRHDRIHIFGAGTVASLMLRYLKEEEIPMCYALVSPGRAKAETFQGLPLKEFTGNFWRKGDGVLIAVDERFRREIFQSLVEFGLSEDDIYIQQIYNLCYKGFFVKDALLTGVESNTIFFDNFRELDQLGKRNETDKSSNHHDYLNKYEFFLREFKNKPINILELGVYNGGSLKTWKDYFTKAEIYGVDFDERCKVYQDERCHVILQDLGDEELLDQLSFISPSVIVDDASHYMSDQIKALYHLLPILRSGGIYIIEDLGTSFTLYRNMGLQDAIVTCYEFCKAITDVVASREYLNIEKMNPVCVPLKKEIEFLADQIEMISFIHESCIIVKR